MRARGRPVIVGRPGLRGDRGAGTVLALGVAFAALAMLALVLPLGTALIARQRVVSAADAAALAAADAVRGLVAGDPCALAEELAATADATLVDCALAPESATVTVAGTVVGIRFEVRARAGAPWA